MNIETLEIAGLFPAIRGMRNPMKSWDKSDSFDVNCDGDFQCGFCGCDKPDGEECDIARWTGYLIGPKDLELAKRLANAGSDHAKFLRQIVVWADITAPRYFWSEFDTHRIGVEKNSESTMHTILKDEIDPHCFEAGTHLEVISTFKEVVEHYKKQDFFTEAEKIRFIKMCLPESFLQTRTVMMSYAALRSMYHSRKNHRLPEWRETFCEWVKELPYSELITGEDK